MRKAPRSRRGLALRDPLTVAVLRALCEGLLPGDSVLQVSEKRLRACFAHVAKCLRLEHLSLRPYSLRRGGATHLFRRSGSYDTVAHVGQWSSIHTTRRYISDAVAALASLQLDDWQRRIFAALSAEFKVWLSQFLE